MCVTIWHLSFAMILHPHHPFNRDFPWNKPASYWGTMTNYGKPHLKQRRCGARWWSWWKASSPSPQPALRDARPIPTQRRSLCNGRVHRHDFLAYPLHTYQASLIQHMLYEFYICVTWKLKDIQRIVEDIGSWNLNDVLSLFSVVVAIRSIQAWPFPRILLSIAPLLLASCASPARFQLAEEMRVFWPFGMFSQFHPTFGHLVSHKLPPAFVGLDSIIAHVQCLTRLNPNNLLACKDTNLAKVNVFLELPTFRYVIHIVQCVCKGVRKDMHAYACLFGNSRISSSTGI